MAGRVVVLGIPETEAAIAASVAAANAGDTLDRAAELIAGAAALIGPDRTGLLSSSYQGAGGAVVTHVVYGPFVEYGTVRMPAQRRIARAFTDRLGEVETIMGEAIDAQGDREGL
jgi:hypothetical protein